MPDELLTSNTARSSPAKRTSEFKYHNRDKKGPFRVVQLIDLAKEWVANGTRKHVRASIPADVFDGVESVGDCWNRRGNDHSVEGHEEEGKVYGSNDKPEGWRAWIVSLLGGIDIIRWLSFG